MVRSVFLPVVFLAATGCSAVVAGSPGDGSDAQSTSVTGVIVVDRTVNGDETTRGEASARFVKLRGAIDDGALRLASASLDLPAIGECSKGQDQASTRAVELLDVGQISIESGAGQHVVLASRQVPDVVDLVSGTMYSTRIDEQTMPSGGDVAVLVTGSADVPGFSVRAVVPDAPSAVRVNSLSSGNVELTWAAGSDSIYVDVNVDGRALRCSFADDGRAIVPVSLGDDGVIAVHRVRREKLSIPGLDGGELRFDFARTVSLRH